MKFKVKPFTIDAEQWYPDKQYDTPIEIKNGMGIMRTPEGNTYTLQPGDWIVTNSNGVKTTYTQKNFELLYDPVGPEDLSNVLASTVDRYYKSTKKLPVLIEIGEYIMACVGLDSLTTYHTSFGISIPVKVVTGDKIFLKETV